MAETCNQSVSVVLLELMEATAIEDARENSVHVEWFFVINWNDSSKICSGVERLLWLNHVLSVAIERVRNAQVLDDRTSKLDGVCLIVS